MKKLSRVFIVFFIASLSGAEVSFAGTWWPSGVGAHKVGFTYFQDANGNKQYDGNDTMVGGYDVYWVESPTELDITGAPKWIQGYHNRLGGWGLTPPPLN